jgi:hypothetical protein
MDAPEKTVTFSKDGKVVTKMTLAHDEVCLAACFGASNQKLRITSVQAVGAAPPPTSPWSCEACTFENPASAATCELCSTARPVIPVVVEVTCVHLCLRAPWLSFALLW